MSVREGLSRLRSRVAGHRFLRNVGVLLGGTAIGQGVLLLASPVMSRLYTPAEWGTLAAFAALLSMALPVSSLRLEIAITVVDSEEEAAGISVLSLLILAATVAFSAVLLTAFGDALARWTDAPALEPLLWLLPPALALGGLYSVLRYGAVRRGEFSIISRSEISRPVTKAVTQVGLGILGAGPSGLVIGEVTGRLGGLVPLAQRARKALLPHASALRARYLSALMRRHWRFPVLTGSGTMLSSLAGHLPALLTAGLFGPQAAGWLALGQRAVLMPTSFLGRSVAQVYLGRAGGLAGRDPSKLRRLFLRTSAMMLVLGAAPALALLLAGPDLFGWVFGDEWREAGHYARLLAPLFLAQFVVYPLASTLDLLRRHWVKLLWDGARLAVVCAAFVVPYRIGADAALAVGSYGTGVAALYAALYLITLHGIGRNDMSPDAAEEDEEVGAGAGIRA